MITFVNVFTVLPEKQQDAFQAIQKVYTDVVAHQPGFIAAKLIVSDDGVRVTAIANWESEENLKALRNTQGFKDLHNETFYNVTISSDGHVYSKLIEIKPQ
ncbi:MAG: antibiotic biosynthesis monooxygenase [Microcoleus vaginatus WJT46-NPBG5]|jgi:heme-degrading monooxygenase HmoA|nr:antibiotic biosynthesis monooxygenase [Microcoleus vaginatus WJT46-NPBG5]